MKNLLSVLTLVFVFCLPIVSVAQCENGVCAIPSTINQSRQSPPACVARIRVNYSNYGNLGTGTLISVNDSSGLVFTNAHLFDVGKTVSSVTVGMPEGDFQGELINLDREWDLAAIRIDKPKATPIRVSDTSAVAGDVVWLYGYGHRGNSFRIANGQTKGYMSNKGGESKHILVVSVGSRDGDSGGPMVNDKGELVGILSHTDGWRTTGTCSIRVKSCAERFIMPWNAEAAQAETKADAAEKQALIALIQKNGAGTDPALVARIAAIESQLRVITDQAQKFLGMPKMEMPTPIALAPVVQAPRVARPREASPIVLPVESSKMVDFAWGAVEKLLWWVPGIGIAIWLGRKFKVTGTVAGMGAKGIDRLTDWIPGTWDDKLLDPLAYKVAAYMGAKAPVVAPVAPVVPPVVIPPVAPVVLPVVVASVVTPTPEKAADGS